MQIAILDAATLGNDLSLKPFERFGKVRVYPNTAPDEVEEHIRNAEILILNKVRLGERELTSALPTLRLICIAATGYDNVDLYFCRTHGIAVCNVVGYSSQSVAQVTVAMALSLMTHLSEYSEYVRNGSYTESGIANSLSPVYHEIAGKTWGLVGFGNIGKQVGTVARALGCRVLVHKRTPIPDWECADMDTLCRESDLLSLHVPLNEQTTALLNRARIDMLRPNAIVINVARGVVVDEAALADAVSEGRIGGIGIDVYSREPLPKTHPLFRLRNQPNVCLTPHMAWGGFETRCRLLSEIEKNIEAFQNGDRRCRVD